MWGLLTDALSTVFLCCFGCGLFFSAVSLLGRGHLGHVHLPLGHHGGQVGLPGHGSHANAGAPSFFNPSSVAIFLLWFGATGSILHTYYGARAGVSLIAATFVGWLGAAAIYLLMAKVLWRGQTALDPENYRIGGALGYITSPIRAGGTGEVIYTLDGKRRVDGARSEDGSPIAAGTAVAIVGYRDGLAYVCPLDRADRDEPEV